MAISYRQLERPTLIDVGMRSGDSGAASLAQSFADFNAQVKNTAASVGSAFAAKVGAERGAQAGREGEPAFRKGLRSLTSYGRAYNDAATRTYALRAEQDINETAARLETEAGKDPNKFRTAMEAARKATIGAAASNEARAVIDDLYGRRTSEGLERLVAAEALEIREESRSAIAESAAQMAARASYMRSQGDEVSGLQADEEIVKFNLMIDGAVRDGTFSEIEGAAARRQFDRDVVRGAVTQQLQNEINDPLGDPIGLIENVIEIVRTDETLTPEDESKLMTDLFSTLSDHNRLRSAREAEMAAQVEARYNAGDRAATGQLLSGKLTQRDLLEMVENDEIRPEIARTLLNELQSSATRAPKSDPAELFHVETNLLSMTEEEIATYQGLTWDDRSRLILKRRAEAEGWKSTQVAREAFDRIDRALGIVPGLDSKFLTEDERRARDEALTELYELVDALPEEERQAAVLTQAQDVIRRRISERSSNEIARLRDAMARYRDGIGDPAQLDDVRRADFDAQIQRYEARIRELESKVQP